MLRKVRMLDYSVPYTYAPPQVEALVNVEDVVSVRPADARGYGPFVVLRLRDGTQMTVVGSVDDFLPTAKEG